MVTIGWAVSSNDNDQVRPAGKDHVIVKPVWPVCACVATMLQKINISNWIIEYIHIQLDIFIYSKCKFNIDLYWIIRFLVFGVIYLSVIYFFADPFLLNIEKIYDGYTKLENLGFYYQPISMPDNITKQYLRRIRDPAKLQWSSFTKIVNG